MACNKNCHFFNVYYVESEPDESDTDPESEEHDINDFYNDSKKQIFKTNVLIVTFKQRISVD